MRMRSQQLLLLLYGMLELIAVVTTQKDKSVNHIDTSRRVRLRGVKWWYVAN